jgi:hypothetical protein
MRKSLKIGTIVAFISFIIVMDSSCNRGNIFPKATASLDSIYVVLHKTDSALAKVDTVTIRKCVNHIFITLENVKRLDQDTVSHGASDILRSFNAVRWELQTYLGKHPILRTEVKKSIAQVDNLSHDIKNNKIPRDSVMMYYGYEMKRAVELIETAKYGINSASTQVSLYGLIVPQADSLIARLNNHEKI